MHCFFLSLSYFLFTLIPLLFSEAVSLFCVFSCSSMIAGRELASVPFTCTLLKVCMCQHDYVYNVCAVYVPIACANGRVMNMHTCIDAYKHRLTTSHIYLVFAEAKTMYRCYLVFAEAKTMYRYSYLIGTSCYEYT